MPGELMLGIPRPILLIPIAAIAYAAATFGIKMAASTVSSSALCLIIAGFTLAALAEAVLLRHADLGVIYLSIIAVETLAVLCIAAWIGDGLNFKQILGATLVLSGIALVGT